MVDADWHALCQALYEGIEGEDWGEFFVSYKELSRAVGVKKPQEAQKAKALWKMKVAKDAGEEYDDPEREDNILGRNNTRLALLGRTSQRSPKFGETDLGGLLALLGSDR